MNELLRGEFVFRFDSQRFSIFAEKRKKISEMILLLQLTVKNRSLFPWNEARDRKRIKHLWDLFDDRPVRQRDAICENFIAFLLKLLRNEFPFAYFFRCEVYSPGFRYTGDETICF